MEKIPLNKLKEGEEGVIAEEGRENRRLRDLGLITGTKVKCLYRSPLKDPTAYEIRGAVVALREEDCNDILVEVCSRSMEKRKRLKVALAGNPNVGKSTVFNCLTGMRQHTGNWAGKTVDCARGLWRIKGNGADQEIDLIDIPGCYSLETVSPEEEVARDFICDSRCDGVIIVCDGTCLERNLILTLQILRFHKSAAVCVNLMDQVKKRKIKIDAGRLSELLGVPVIVTEAGKKKEMRESLETVVREWKEREKEDSAKDYVSEGTGDPKQLVKEAERIASQVVGREEEIPDGSLRIDKILTNPVWGFPAMAVLLLFIFWLTMKGANYPSAALSRFLFSFEEPFYTWLLDMGLPDSFCEMAAHGMYRVSAWVVSVMLPPMVIFFPLFTLLEDWGFLPRVAFNLDRCFQCCNACGKQALTLCMGFGCNACGVVGCRIIDSKRERLLAMVTNSLVPCNGRFPMLICVITMFFAADGGIGAAAILTAVILLGIAATFVLSKILSVTLLKGVPSSFTLELPPFRRPEVGKVIVRSIFDRTLFVLGRAVVVAAPAGMLIWILANLQWGEVSFLERISAFLDPAGRFIGLDGVILLAFLLGLPANEIVIPIMMMIYMSRGTLMEVTDLTFFYQLLLDRGWTMLTAVNVLIFTLMHWPCATTLLSIKKESGSLKWMIVAILAPLAMGSGCCLITTGLYRIFFGG